MNQPFRFRNIRKCFGTRLLLVIDDLDLPTGHWTALIGSNGAGKTTLLKIMAGLETPQHCDISRNGNPSQRWQQVCGSLRHEVVYLHQFPYMFDASVADNVGYGLARNGVPMSQRRTRIANALSQVGVANLAEASARRLSGGERQRVALARALVLQPALLLLDEPTASMDREAREQTLELLQRLKAAGQTTLIVSHDPDALGDLPDTLLRLRDGRLEPSTNHTGNVTPLGRQLATGGNRG